MKNLVLPVLITLAAAGTVYAMTRSDDVPEAEKAVGLPVSALSAPEITPWLLAAAKDLGHQRVRAYDGSVFIDVGDDNISFFKDGKNGFTMHVGFESKYRHTKSAREPALKALQIKGENIFQHALSLQARAEAKERVASRDAAVPTG